MRSQHSFRDIISLRQKKIDNSVQYRVVEIDDVLALAEPLTSELPTGAEQSIPAPLATSGSCQTEKDSTDGKPVRDPGSATGVATFVKLVEARRFPGPLRAGTQDVVARRRVLAGCMNQTALHGMAEEPPVTPVKNSCGGSRASIGYTPSRDRSVVAPGRRCAPRPLHLTTRSTVAKPH